MTNDTRYPYQDGDFTVIGPECFTDGETICWRGVNYRKMPELSPEGASMSNEQLTSRDLKVGDFVAASFEAVVVAVPDRMDYSDTVTVRIAETSLLVPIPASALERLGGVS